MTRVEPATGKRVPLPDGERCPDHADAMNGITTVLANRPGVFAADSSPRRS
jgi:hypothetical protein